MREAVSSLRADGHTDASRYPLKFLWNEVKFADQRRTARARFDAIVMQGAIISVLDKKGAQHFNELLEKLNGGGS